MRIALSAAPVLLLLGALLAGPGARPAHAGDPVTGRIDLAARLEPADLAPGGTGTLIVEGTLLPKLHIAATGETAMRYAPLPADGVTYHMDAVQISPHHPFQDEMGDTLDVWEETFVVKVGVTLAESVAPGATLGLVFTYYGCNDKGCYPPVRDHAATVALGTGAAGGAPVAPAPPGLPADAGPQVAPAPFYEEGGARLEVDEAKGELVVHFEPGFEWHFYGPQDETGSIQVGVKPKKAEGVTWGRPVYPKADQIHAGDGYAVRIPFTREASVRSLTVLVSWQGCQGDAMTGRCAAPHEDEPLTATWPGEGETLVEPPPPDVAPPQETPQPGEVLFPVVDDDEIGGGEDERSWLRTLWSESGFLFFGALFVLGLGLAFTPCVLPIIPITISVISGGKADIPRRRLAALLGLYVLGLCLTFATMGVVAAQTGGAMSALFAMPGVQWGFVVLFLVLGFGMFGVYELQPPAWLMNLQGGAQKRQGSPLGAFLFGCLGAIIASPCTGPAIAVLLLLAAREGSILLGFSMFFVLGLGMGVVLFAAGSLNFLMRPGSWMTWVRYAFGVLIVGVAMYYLRNYQLVSETTMWIVGSLVCILTGVGIAWHLHKREAEKIGPSIVRGVKVGALTAVAIAFVAWYTRVPDDLLSWTYAESPEHLQQLVAESNEAGKPVVVDFWGTWCTNCKVYDKRIATTPSLRQRFERIHRVKVDLSGSDKVRWPMRRALGVEESGAPVMVFIDRQGRIRRKADLIGLQEDDVVAAKIDMVLKETAAATETGAR